MTPGFVTLALVLERYILPWGYGYMAWQRIVALPALYHAYHRFVELSDRGQVIDLMAQNLAGAALVKNLLLALLMSFTGFTLVLSRSPIVRPDKLRQVLIPLAMSYYFLLYGFFDYLPASLRECLLPPRLQGAASVGALILGTVGYSVTLWALIHLGRSFAILVSVRKIVSSGPYVYVRHPIYLGYVIDLCGIVLVTCSLAIFLYAAGFLGLLIVRARLEEEMLAEADENYRQYVRRTGFLLPRGLLARRR